MRTLPLLGATLALLLVAPRTSAQDPTILQAGINSTTSKAEVARSMLSNQKSLATTADGRLWALAHWEDGSFTSTSTLDPTNDASRFLLLMESKDAGQSWARVTAVRTTGSHYGSVVTDPDGYTLHLAWYAWNGQKDSSNWYSSIFYAAFDTRTKAWLGADTTLVPGSNSSSQNYSTPDIAITEGGVIGVTFACARGVPPGWVGGTGSWHSGLVWKQGSTWSAPHRINDDSSGVAVNIQAQGTDFYMSYRVTTGGYGVSVRRFDTVAAAFGPEGEIPAVASATNPNRNVSNLYANNCCHLAVQENGDLYLLYGNGTSSSAGGKLWIAYAPSGTYKFNAPMQIDDDSAMGWGNSTYRFFTLVRDATGQVGAIYSKLVENHQNLYLRLATPVTTVPPYPNPAITLRAGTANDQFQPFMSGYRIQLGRTALMGTYTDLRPIGPLTGGAVRFVGSHEGFGVHKGNGCSGSLPTAPRIAAGGLPKIGGTIDLAMSAHPASTAGILFLGFDDTKLLGTVPLPLDLTGLGMPTCFLRQDLPLTFVYVVNAQGAHGISVPMPNAPGLAGVPIFWQCFVLAQGANATGALVTNGLSTIPR